MEANYSKEALLRFIGYAAEKGLVSTASAKAWRIAVSRFLVDLSDSEEADVRTIDIDIVTRKFANRNPSALTPESLYTYRYRLATAVQEFVAWADNPAGYKPRGTNKPHQPEGKGKVAKASIDRKQRAANGTGEQANSKGVHIDANGLPLPFPIRSDFLAQVLVPRDLTMDEARRLGAFLQTLAVDFKPTEQALYS